MNNLFILIYLLSFLVIPFFYLAGLIYLLIKQIQAIVVQRTFVGQFLAVLPSSLILAWCLLPNTSAAKRFLFSEQNFFTWPWMILFGAAVWLHLMIARGRDAAALAGDPTRQTIPPLPGGSH